MKQILSILAVASMLFLVSCSPFTLVNSETYNNADLAAYKTFRIVTPEEGKLPEGMQLVTYYNIAAAIREQMVERGYVESASSPLLINFAVTVHTEIATEPAYPYGPYGPDGPMGPGFGPGPGPWGGFAPSFIWPRAYYWNPNAQVITGIYKEGVLTMDMVNMPEKLALYSSSVATVMDGSGQYRNLKSIAEAVQTLFSKFPVPLLPEYRKQK